MPYTWSIFVDYLDGNRVIRKEERDELWDALAWLMDNCGGRWRLKAADMTAIKDSFYITDLTVIERTDESATSYRGDLADVLISIEDTFSGTTGYDAFKAVREAEGIDSDDRLAEFVTATGRATEVETYHLWNLYKRVLSYLSCCPTILPTIIYDSVERSYSKCGFDSYAPSSPPRKFRLETLTTVLNWTINCSTEFEHDGSDGYTGTFREDRSSLSDITVVYTRSLIRPDGERGCVNPAPAFSSTAIFHTRIERSNNGGDFGGDDINCFWDRSYSGPPGTPVTESGDPFCGGPTCTFSDCEFPPATYDETETTRVTATNRDCDKSGADGWVVRAQAYLFTETYVLSDEYTDEILEAEVDADIADEGFDDDYNDAAGSRLDWSEDRLSLWKRKSKGAISLAGVANLVDGRAYNLIYVERLIPLDGSPSTDSSELTKSFTYETGMTQVDLGPVPDPITNAEYVFVPLRWECPPAA